MHSSRVKRILLLLFIVIAGKGSAQRLQGGFTADLQFARYLHDKGLYAEVDYVLNQVKDSSLSALQLDSLHYWQGWNAYSTKSLRRAAVKLAAVSDSAAWAQKSHFFAAYCLAFERDTVVAYSLLERMQLQDSLEKEMRYFQLAGISLLSRNYKRYNKLKEHFTFSSYVMEAEEKRMNEYANRLMHIKRKSPWLAGIYSAILPGAGKIYAGKKGQGVGAFLPIASLAALTWEAYNRGGVKDARFIVYGSLFSFFYVGNIWGSVVAVKVKQRELNTLYDNKILFDMHIPLRNLYN